MSRFAQMLLAVCLLLFIALAFTTEASARGGRGSGMMNCNVNPAPTPATPQNLLQSPTTRVQHSIQAIEAQPVQIAKSEHGYDVAALRSMSNRVDKPDGVYATASNSARRLASK